MALGKEGDSEGERKGVGTKNEGGARWARRFWKKRRVLQKMAAMMSGGIGGFLGIFTLGRDHPKVASGIQV